MAKATEEKTSKGPPEDQGGRCFVISPIGPDGSETRRRSNQVLKYVVEAVVSPLGYNVVRADRIADAGLISSQILDHIVNDELVIADLTDANPNVFYELAVRHALGKPFVQLCQLGQDLPFDVQGQRTLFFDHTDLDSVDAVKGELLSAIEAMRGLEQVETPLSVTVNLLSLRASGDPDKQAEAQMLDLLREIERNVSKPRVISSGAPAGTVQDNELLRRFVEDLVQSGDIAPELLQTLLDSSGSRRHQTWINTLMKSVARPVQVVKMRDPWVSDEPPF